MPVALGAWIAAAVGTLFPARMSVVAGLIAAATAVLLRRRAGLALLMAALAVGVAVAGLSVAWHVHRLTVGPVPRLASQHAEVSVALRLVRDPTPSHTAPGLTVVDATVTGVDDRGWRSADSPVLVLSYGDSWTGLLPGQRVTVDGRLSPAQRGDDVAAILDARDPPTPVGRPPWWQRGAGHARNALRSASDGLPVDERGLLPSLVDGDESQVPADLQDDMRATGLTHLEAVSGENVSVTLAIAFGLARGIGLRRRGRVALCAAVLAGFVVLARPSPSVLRAAVMGTVALLGILLGRRTSALPALSVAVLVLVVADPFLARSIGFVLSVVATAALVTIAPGWTQRLEHWLPRPVAVAVAVPAAAQLACTPVLLLAFGQLTPYAVPANLLAGIGVVPATVAGVGCAVVAAVGAPAGVPLAWAGAVPTAWIAGVARAFAGLPGAGLQATGGMSIVLLAALVAMGPAWLVLSRRRDILAAWRR